MKDNYFVISKLNRWDIFAFIVHVVIIGFGLMYIGYAQNVNFGLILALIPIGFTKIWWDSCKEAREDPETKDMYK